jgi:hypothetical protein
MVGNDALGDRLQYVLDIESHTKFLTNLCIDEFTNPNFTSNFECPTGPLPLQVFRRNFFKSLVWALFLAHL